MCKLIDMTFYCCGQRFDFIFLDDLNCTYKDCKEYKTHNINYVICERCSSEMKMSCKSEFKFFEGPNDYKRYG